MNLLQRSLAWRMAVVELITIVGFSVLLAGNLLWEFSKSGEGEIDKQLLIAAQSLAITVGAEQLNTQDTTLVIGAIDRASREGVILYKKDKKLDHAKNTIAVRVANEQGQEIYRTPGYSTLPLNAASSQAYSFEHQGESWRAVNYRAREQRLVVQIAQNMHGTEGELWGLVVTYILWPLLWFLPLVALTSAAAVSSGLRPLRVLAQVISRRSPSDMSALSHTPTHAEIKPLVNEINMLLHKLDTTLSRERNFLADAAHELRTPLAVIQAQAHVLTHARNDADKAQATSELNLGIERAASLIQKLLLTAKVSVESFAPHLETIDLSAFVQERMAALSVLAAQKGIDIELHAPPACQVQIDRETFISAVDNVLDNAIRYTPEGGHIQVHITSPSPGKVQLRIADNGAGIAPHLYARVLERFYRIAGTEQQGSGLGLAIVQRALALHGGDVALAPGLNQRGLSVALTLPIHTLA